MTKTAFTQSDVSRAVKGVMAAGVEVGRVEIGRDGRVIVYSAAIVTNDDATPLDHWRRNNGAG